MYEEKPGRRYSIAGPSNKYSAVYSKGQKGQADASHFCSATWTRSVPPPPSPSLLSHLRRSFYSRACESIEVYSPVPSVFCSAGPRTYIYPPLTSCPPPQGNSFASPPPPCHYSSRLPPENGTINENMFAQPVRQSTSADPSMATSESPKQVTTIAVHVSTTVHTVVEPCPPGMPIEARSGESSLPC
jgi:hypothetical protein